jgi:hypothetical protein
MEDDHGRRKNEARIIEGSFPPIGTRFHLDDCQLGFVLLAGAINPGMPHTVPATGASLARHHPYSRLHWIDCLWTQLGSDRVEIGGHGGSDSLSMGLRDG